MPETFEFRPWPVCTNNIAWSADNIVATALSGNIELLVPRYSRVGSTDRWITASIEASSFTLEENPLLDPAPWSTFDVGEELSDRNVISHAWSSPGLGKHGACVLAVLTSNHVLSLWAHSGRPDLSDDWHRVSIINNTLNLAHRSDEYSRNGKRIHSFEWIPVPLNPAEQEGVGGRTALRTFCLAASDDLGSIHIIRVWPQHDFGKSHAAMRIEVVATVPASQRTTIPRPLLAALPSFDDLRPAFIDRIACSPWDIGPDGAIYATLAFACLGQLHSIRLRWVGQGHNTNMEADASTLVSIPHMPNRISGSLQWAPRLGSAGSSLVFFSTTSIYCLSVSPMSGAQLSARDLDTTWKQVAGMYFATDEAGNTTITFGIHRDTQRLEQVVFPLPLQEDTSRPNPKWHVDVNKIRDMHDTRDENRGHTYVRLYGLANSALNDQSATCISTHPDDAVEYSILAAQATTLILSREEDSSAVTDPGSNSSILPCEVSAEALFPFILRALGTAGDGPFDAGSFSQDMLRVTGLSSLLTTETDGNVYKDMNITQAAILLRKIAVFDRECVLSRYRRLIQLAQDGPNKIVKPDLVAVRRFVSEAIKVAAKFIDESDLNKLVLQNYRIVERKIASHDSDDVDGMPEINTIETCKVCNDTIPFEALKWGRCSNGHQFNRCGLTFLTMQSPGMSKACGICGTQYLTEHAINGAEEDASTELGNEPHVEHSTQGEVGVAKSFAWIVLTACDVCIYCGGKFVG